MKYLVLLSLFACSKSEPITEKELDKINCICVAYGFGKLVSVRRYGSGYKVQCSLSEPRELDNDLYVVGCEK